MDPTEIAREVADRVADAAMFDVKLLSCLLALAACSAAPVVTPAAAAAAPSTASKPATPEPLPSPVVVAPAPAVPGPACKDLGATPGSPPTPLFTAAGPGSADTKAQGTDVSDAQGTVPWRALTVGGLDFAFARASEGTTIRDEHFATNWSMMKACGLPRGAYHVFEPTEDADAQVEHFLAQLAGDFGELPPVVDVEITPQAVAQRTPGGKAPPFPAPAAYQAALLRWMSLVEAKTGKRVMIYIQPWYWSTYLGADPKFTQQPLWAAGSAPRGTANWPWVFWQHGQPAHWDSRVWDLDLYSGGETELLSANFGVPAR